MGGDERRCEEKLIGVRRYSFPGIENNTWVSVKRAGRGQKKYPGHLRGGESVVQGLYL
jgi:hypothetical protein